jgi:hypothetical protein
MKFLLLIFVIVSVFNLTSAFENCGVEYQDPKLTHALEEFLEYVDFEKLSAIAQKYLPEHLRFYGFLVNFTISLKANPKMNHALGYICEKTHFDLFGWWTGFWANFRTSYSIFKSAQFKLNSTIFYRY